MGNRTAPTGQPPTRPDHNRIGGSVKQSSIDRRTGGPKVPILSITGTHAPTDLWQSEPSRSFLAWDEPGPERRTKPVPPRQSKPTNPRRTKPGPPRRTKPMAVRRAKPRAPRRTKPRPGRSTDRFLVGWASSSIDPTRRKCAGHQKPCGAPIDEARAAGASTFFRASGGSAVAEDYLEASKRRETSSQLTVFHQAVT